MLNICWRIHYRNRLTDAKLEIGLWEGHPPFPGVVSYERPHWRKSEIFLFDLLEPDTSGWKSSGTTYREYDSKSLAEHILKYYMDDAEPKK